MYGSCGEEKELRHFLIDKRRRVWYGFRRNG